MGRCDGKLWKQKGPLSEDRGPLNYSRRRSTLPPALAGSTIDAEGLNCRVRNGNGCFPLAIATGNLARSVKKNCGSGAALPMTDHALREWRARPAVPLQLRIFRSLTTAYWELTLCLGVLSFQKFPHRKSIFPPRDSHFPGLTATLKPGRTNLLSLPAARIPLRLRSRVPADCGRKK